MQEIHLQMRLKQWGSMLIRSLATSYMRRLTPLENLCGTKTNRRFLGTLHHLIC